METELKKIFGDKIKIGNLIVPTAHLKYKGNSRTYVVWSIIDEIPIFAYEDEIQYSAVLVDIDIYSESNYLNIISYIKKIMKENEWIWKEDSEERYEQDTGLYNKTCSFEKERKI